MNILFIIPNYPELAKSYLVLPPLELTTISAGLLQANHSVELYDMRINDYNENDLETFLIRDSYDFVCIESEFFNYCKVKKIIELCKKYNPEAYVAIHGEVASLAKKTLMERNRNIDFVLMHEVEFTFVELIDAIEKELKFDKINNLIYRNGNEIVQNDISFIMDINSLPIAYRHLFDSTKYLRRDSETIVRSTRGCPGKCAFCTKTMCSKFRIFSVERFFDEVEELIQDGFESFFFSDDTFSFSDRRIDEICEEIEKRGLQIKWTSNMRIRDINEYKIKKMKEYGAYRVFVGIETINSKSSDLISKNITKEMIESKIDILKKYNMEFHASFILGCPGDTEEDVYETFKFISQIKPTLITINKLKVYPGTELYEKPEKYDVIMENPFWYEEDEWTKRTLFGTNQLPPSKIDELWKEGMRFFFLEGVVE